MIASTDLRALTRRPGRHEHHLARVDMRLNHFGDAFLRTREREEFALRIE